MQKLLKVVREDDIIVFDSVSRMSRSAEEGYKIYQELFNKGVELVFIKEPHINTQTYRKALKNQNISLTSDDKVNYIIEGVNKYFMALAEE